MRKALLLFLYGTALYLIVRRRFQLGDTGMPPPNAVAAPTYLYGMLLLAADFLEALPVFLGAGLTLALIWNLQGNPSNPKAHANPSNAGKKGGPAGFVKVGGRWVPIGKNNIVPTAPGRGSVSGTALPGQR